MTDAEKVAHYEDILGITENNDRYTKLRDAFEMSPGATWLLSRLVAAKGRWIPKGVLLDAIPGFDEADDRHLSAVKVRVHEIRKRLGKSVIDWDRELGYRLSKSGIEVTDKVLAIFTITWYRGTAPMPRPPAPTPVPEPVVSIHVEPLRLDEATVRRIVNDPDVLPIDRMRIHGAWRASGG